MERIIVLSPLPPGPDGQFPNFDSGKYLGGQVRLDAAAKLMLDSPSTEFSLVGGYNKPDEGDPLTSNKVDQMAAFLRARSSNANLRLVPSLTCTHHNFVAVINSWLAAKIDIAEAGVLTNGYHLKRALEFANRAAAAINPNHAIRFIPISAETVLGLSIDEVVAGRRQEYYVRIASEARGLEQIKDGTYTDNCLTTNLEAMRLALKAHAPALLTPSERRTITL